MLDTLSDSVPPRSADSPGKYFEWVRTDILSKIPASVQHVLSVGCGAGATEAQLVRRGIKVTGIEIDPVAVDAARRNGLRVIEGNAVIASIQLANSRFDCLIYADVLEHIADPVAVLRSHLGMLEPGGRVIISVPNFRHYGVFWQLFVRGHVRYTDAGILDRTHVRLTTRRMVEEWFREVGLRRTGLTYNMSQRREKLISACSLGLLRDLVARQVIIIGEKS